MEPHGPLASSNMDWKPFCSHFETRKRTQTKAVDEQKHQEQRPQAPVEKKQQPTTVPTVEIKRNEVLTPVPKKHDQFQLNEISTPISSFMIKDILGK